jgi:hypothetical protein
MAVYFEPRSKQWWDYLAEAGTELLGGVIKNQFDKGAEKRKFQMEQDSRDADIARINGLGFDRSNEGQFLRDIAVRDFVGGGNDNFHLDLQATNLPWYTQDNGGSIMSGFANPTTGETAFRNYAKDVDPKIPLELEAGLQLQREADAAAMERTRMTEAGANRRAGMNRQRPGQLVPLGNGKYGVFDGYSVTPTEYDAPGQGGAMPQMSAGDFYDLARSFPELIDPLSGQPYPGTEDLVAQLISHASAGIGGGNSGGFTMPEYQPNPVYTPGAGSRFPSDRPQGWTADDEAMFQKAEAEGRGQEFMNAWNNRYGVKKTLPVHPQGR